MKSHLEKLFSSFFHSIPHRTFALGPSMGMLTTSLIINVAQNSSLTTLPRFGIPLKAPNIDLRLSIAISDLRLRCDCVDYAIVFPI